MPRKEERLAGLSRCEVKYEDQIIPAVVTTMSRHGLSLKSDTVMPTFRVVELKLYFETKTISLNGSIRWVNEQVREDKPNFHEIGVAVLNPAQDYVDLFTEEK